MNIIFVTWKLSIADIAVHLHRAISSLLGNILTYLKCICTKPFTSFLLTYWHFPHSHARTAYALQESIYIYIYIFCFFYFFFFNILFSLSLRLAGLSSRVLFSFLSSSVGVRLLLSLPSSRLVSFSFLFCSLCPSFCSSVSFPSSFDFLAAACRSSALLSSPEGEAEGRRDGGREGACSGEACPVTPLCSTAPRRKPGWRFTAGPKYGTTAQLAGPSPDQRQSVKTEIEIGKSKKHRRVGACEFLFSGFSVY